MDAIGPVATIGDVVRIAGALLWLILPGAALVLRLQPPAARDLASFLALSIACGIALALSVATILGIAGASFDVLFIALWGLFVAGAVSLLRGARGAAAALRRLHAGILIGAVIAFAAGAATMRPFGVATDAIDHVATCRAIVERGEIEPNTVFYAGGDGARPDVRKGYGHAVAAALTRTAGLDPVHAWHAVRPFAFAGAFLAFALLARMLLAGGAGLAVSLLAFPLLVHGNATWFLDTIVYPHNLDWILVWSALALVVDELVRSSARTRLVIVLMCMSAAGLHVFAPVLLLAGVVSMIAACVVFAPAAVRGAALRTFLLCVASAAPLLVARLATTHHPVNPLHVETSEVLYLTGFLQLHNPTPMLQRFSLPALLVALGALLLVRRRASVPRAALWGLAICPLLVSLNPVAGGLLIPSIGYLFVRFLGVVPYPIVAGALVAAALSLRGARRVAMVSAVALLALWRLPALAGLFSAGPMRPTPEAWESGFDLVREHVPRGATVLSDPFTSYALPAFTGRRVVTVLDQHSSPSDSTILERTDAVVRALSPYRPIGEAVAACERYGAATVLVNDFDGRRVESFFDVRHPALVEAVRARFDGAAAFRLLGDAGGFALYAFEPGNVRGREPPAHVPWRVESPTDTDPIRLSDALLLHAVSLRPPALAPGDTLVVVVVLEKTARERPATPYRTILRLRNELEGVHERFEPIERLYARALGVAGGPRLELAVNRRPLDGRYPPAIWDPGETIADTLGVALPVDLEPGVYRVGIRVNPQRLIRNIALGDWLRPRGGIGIPVGEIVVESR